jgi:NAD(P)-dependent dehydrogenase (short-subunit alcohol dehydrogenase family)
MAKASLHMGIKNLSIELQRKNPNAIIVALHPGTVDSELSKPFQKNVAEGKLFSPAFSAQSLLKVLHQLTPKDSGKIWAWDGKEIMP